MKTLGIMLAGLLTLTANASAQAERKGKPATTAQPVEYAAPVVGYEPVILAANIAPTPGTVEDPSQRVEVFGEPRMVKGHPCTLWDQQDIERYKELLKTDANMQKMLSGLIGRAEKRIKQPLNVPGAHKDSDGNWMWPGSFPTNEPPFGNHSKNCADNSGVMSELAIAYALTGEAKYGEYCRQMFLAYAENFPRWNRSPKATWRSCSDGRFSWQFLNDGFDLLQFGWAFDLIYNLPSLTAEDKAKIRDNFFRPAVAPFFTQGRAGVDYLSTPDNRSVLCAAAVLVDGYATDDQEMIDFALQGHAGTKLRAIITEGIKSGTAERELGGKQDDKTPGGLMNVHFGPRSILPDGLWIEGAPGYTVGIAACGLFDAAEVLWRHGVDMYRYRNGALKRMLDSALLLANPDSTLTVPCLRDSGPFSIIDERGWLNGEIGASYNCGYRRYRNPQYLPVLHNASEHLGMTVHSGPPFIKDQLPAVSPASVVPMQNVNYYATGYGVLRIAEGALTNSLLMQFGSSCSGHDHPSLLGLNLYTWGDTLMPFPGVIFPYNDPLDVKWYWTTMANCTMEVDQDDQLYGGNRYRKYPGAPMPTNSPQLVYAPATTLGMQRAYSICVYPGTTLDRSLFMTACYMADLFGGFSSVPRTYDLAWHFRGAVTPDLPLVTMQFAEPVPNGYNALDNVRHAMADKAWSAAVTFHEKPLKFFAAAGAGTEVIVGDGHFNGYKEHPPTILERRVKQNTTLYGNVMDLSGQAGGYVKSVAQEGGLEAGYGLLKVETVNGTDLCFATYRPGTYKAGGLETDAQQAMVVMAGQKVRALYLGGGKTLQVAGVSISRSEPGLAYVEKLENGTFVVGNPSPSDATVTVVLPDRAVVTANLKAGATIKLPAKGK
jgi:hypothetical protein